MGAILVSFVERDKDGNIVKIHYPPQERKGSDDVNMEDGIGRNVHTRLYDRIILIGSDGTGRGNLVGKSWIGIGDDGVVDIYLGDESVIAVEVIDLLVPAGKEGRRLSWRRWERPTIDNLT